MHAGGQRCIQAPKADNNEQKLRKIQWQATGELVMAQNTIAMLCRFIAFPGRASPTAPAGMQCGAYARYKDCTSPCMADSPSEAVGWDRMARFRQRPKTPSRRLRPPRKKAGLAAMPRAAPPNLTCIDCAETVLFCRGPRYPDWVLWGRTLAPFANSALDASAGWPPHRHRTPKPAQASRRSMQ